MITNNTVKELQEIAKALFNGQAIESTRIGGPGIYSEVFSSFDSNPLRWDLDFYHYRVKPSVPKEVWIRFNGVKPMDVEDKYRSGEGLFHSKKYVLKG